MDVKLPKVKKSAVFEDNEEKIQYLVDNCLINKAEGLYKTGTIIANCMVVLEGREAHSRIRETGEGGSGIEKG